MTKEQCIRQNRDLRIRFENYKSLHEVIEHELKSRIRELEHEVRDVARDKDNTIRSLQSCIVSRDKAYDAVFAEAGSLKKELSQSKGESEKRQETVNALTARLNKDSSNSSIPPSMDGFKKVIHNSRPATSRKPGAQLGHKGHGIGMSEKLKVLIGSGAVPVEIVGHGERCNVYSSKYEIDIRTVAVVREHRFYQGSPVPAELANPVNYGPKLRAACVYLSTVGLVAAQRVSGFIEDITDGAVKPSKASVLAFQKSLASLLSPEIEAIREDILKAPVMGVDETPLKSTQRLSDDGETIEESKGTTHTITARTYSTADSVLLTVSSRKDIKGVVLDNLLPQSTGTIVHDHDTKYYNFGSGKQGECNIHILRYLKGLLELTRHTWLAMMAALLLSMLDHKNKDIDAGICAMDADALHRYSEEYDRIISIAKTENAELPAKSQVCTDENNLFSRLAKYKDNHLLFACDYTVPFTNNDSESDLRWIKQQQKVSGCHRSFYAAKDMMRLMSFILTCKKRKIPVFAALNNVLLHHPVLASGNSKLKAS